MPKGTPSIRSRWISSNNYLLSFLTALLAVSSPHLWSIHCLLSYTMSTIPASPPKSPQATKLEPSDPANYVSLDSVLPGPQDKPEIYHFIFDCASQTFIASPPSSVSLPNLCLPSSHPMPDSTSTTLPAEPAENLVMIDIPARLTMSKDNAERPGGNDHLLSPLPSDEPVSPTAKKRKRASRAVVPVPLGLRLPLEEFIRPDISLSPRHGERIFLVHTLLKALEPNSPAPPETSCKQPLVIPTWSATVHEQVVWNTIPSGRHHTMIRGKPVVFPMTSPGRCLDSDFLLVTLTRFSDPFMWAPVGNCGSPEHTHPAYPRSPFLINAATISGMPPQIEYSTNFHIHQFKIMNLRDISDLVLTILCSTMTATCSQPDNTENPNQLLRHWQLSIQGLYHGLPAWQILTIAIHARLRSFAPTHAQHDALSPFRPEYDHTKEEVKHELETITRYRGAAIPFTQTPEGITTTTGWFLPQRAQKVRLIMIKFPTMQLARIFPRSMITDLPMNRHPTVVCHAPPKVRQQAFLAYDLDSLHSLAPRYQEAAAQNTAQSQTATAGPSKPSPKSRHSITLL